MKSSTNKLRLSNSSLEPEVSETDGPVAMRPFDQSLPMLLLRAREAVMRGFRRQLRRHGLNEQEWRIIRVLAEVDQIEIGELAGRVFILKPSATRTVRNLQARKLVVRAHDASDMRRAHISLTAAGRKLFAKVAPSSEAEYARLTAVLGADELEELYTLLARIPPLLAEEAEIDDGDE